MNYSNISARIRNKFGQEEQILHGVLNRNLTKCKPGEDFDLIMKNDNFHLANWIFNAQPLQHKVRSFARMTVRRSFQI